MLIRPWTWTTRPAGGITLLAKFVDRFGNESVNAASLALTLNGAYVRNVVGSEDYHAAGFPGTIAQGAVSGGNLDAQVTTLMYRSGARLMYSQDGTSLFYPATQYSGLDYITSWWTPPSAQAGDADQTPRGSASTDDDLALHAEHRVHRMGAVHLV